MVKRSRKNRTRKGLSLFGRLYSPFDHLFSATGNSVREVSRGVGNVAGKVVTTVNKVGKTYAKGVNNTVSNLTRARKNRSGRKSRRNGRSGRKSRRN